MLFRNCAHQQVRAGCCALDQARKKDLAFHSRISTCTLASTILQPSAQADRFITHEVLLCWKIGLSAWSTCRPHPHDVLKHAK